MTEEELYTTYKGRYLSKMIYTPESLKYYEEFTFRPDDIVVATYPKSGSTWMQEIISLIQSEGDLTPVLTIPPWKRVPWLEAFNTRRLNLEQRASPRLFATHYHYDMMPGSFHEVKPKVIYVMRNPRDVFTSSYHFCGMAKFLVNPGTTDEYLDKFLSGRVMFGSWFDHTKSWLSGDQHRIMYISYEEMILDLRDSVARISQFMGKPLSSEVIEKIADQCEFKNMKDNKMSNNSQVPIDLFDLTKSFFRKGISGDWKNLLTAEQAEQFDRVYKDEMKDVKYKFIWDSNVQATGPGKDEEVVRPVFMG